MRSILAISLQRRTLRRPTRKLEEPKNKTGYREASCGTLSYLDKEGNRISTVRLARMPEAKKQTLKAQLTAEFDWSVAQRPDLTIVALRGNVPTRLRKLDSDHLDAVVLACAGLDRLGLGRNTDSASRDRHRDRCWAPV